MTRRLNFGTGGSGWQRRHRIARNVNRATAMTHAADIGGLRIGAEAFLALEPVDYPSSDVPDGWDETDWSVAKLNFRAAAHRWLTKSA